MNYARKEIITPVLEDEKTETETDPRLQAEIQYQLERLLKMQSGKLTPEQLAKKIAIEHLNLENRADHDELVAEVLNRRGFINYLDNRLQQYHRDRQNGRTAVGSILFIDYDDFKRTNDKYGQAIGDEVLKATGRLTSRSVRPNDGVGRYSGGADEFLVFLDGAELDAAVLVADRIRQDIREVVNEILPQPRDWIQTVSIGVRSTPSDAELINYGSREDRRSFIERWIHETNVVTKNSAKVAGKDKIGVMQDDGKIQTASIKTVTEGQPPIITYHDP
ncbi:GGDEF domain-containing protein [Candidatus Daviesbacteria bacterium]|nr:GGDEF domain-containing protein [Candidatus Daviesbacteria bacterium]